MITSFTWKSGGYHEKGLLGLETITFFSSLWIETKKRPQIDYQAIDNFIAGMLRLNVLWHARPNLP